VYLPQTDGRLLGLSRQFFVLIDQRAKMLFDSRRGDFRLECPEACRGAKIFGRMLLNWLIRIFIEIGHVGGLFSLSPA
jgi:hypothetical protein